MGRVTENGYIVMTEVLSTVQDLYRKLSSARSGNEWARASHQLYKCRVVCGHQGWRGVTSAMDRAESLLSLDYCDQNLESLLVALDEVMIELRPRVHGAPTIPSGPPHRALA